MYLFYIYIFIYIYTHTHTSLRHVAAPSVLGEGTTKPIKSTVVWCNHYPFIQPKAHFRWAVHASIEQLDY